MFTFFGDHAESIAATVAERLHTLKWTGLDDATPAFERLMVEFTNRSVYEKSISPLIEWLQSVPPSSSTTPRRHEIPVHYNGEDLPVVAKHADLPVSEVIQRHQAVIYRVALIGFSPGFPYLEGMDPKLHTPRRDTPRPSIPAGSVAIGASHTGIYSLPTPGGWNLIGSTSIRLFDLSRSSLSDGDPSVFLLQAGDEVKFSPV